MKRAIFILTIFILVLGLSCLQNNSNPTNLPLPKDGTIVRTGQSEDEDNANRRELYFENMHRAAPNTDWRAIDRQSQKDLYKKRISFRQSNVKMAVETFANGDLVGEWFERGSKDQAGSITQVDYDVTTDKIYAISAGGTVWKGERSGNVWTPQNEDLQFDRNILKIIDDGNGGKRLLASIGKVIHSSDDDGATWIESTGFNFFDGWGGPKSMYVLDDANNTIYYLVKTWDSTPWAGRMWLFRSTDRGLTFSQIHTFNHSDQNRISMWSPFESTDLYILDRSTTLYEVNGATVSVLNTNSSMPIGVDNHLRGHLAGSTLTLYALVDDHKVYQSTNSGDTWTLKGTLPANAWNIGIEVALEDADKLYSGAVEAHRSVNGGSSWTKVNSWWEYYSNVLGDLHADMMDFGTFYDPSGNEFILIANHGGISISYNNMVTNTNISMQNLNVAQYYDVVTSPTNTDFMYAGTQDQGFQRSGQAENSTIVDWEQQISGDYGHMIFSNQGQNLWTQYPGGDMSHYPNPQTGGSTASWHMSGSDLPSYGWMLPSSKTNDPLDNSMYIGGGNINGGGGNFLVKLSYSGGSISATQFSYDFKANSSGSISAVEASTINTQRIYVATDDGSFFYTNNQGTTWTKNNSFSGPGNWYLYGATILASDINSNTVYFGGSGYSNPAVYKSVDGGDGFTAMSNGLPNTLVHELAANVNETLIFAATEIGPFVYVVAQDQWFDMRGLNAPMQRYTSVEFIDNDNLVRFGTYGRGTWDFDISSEVCETIVNVNNSIPSGTYKASQKVISDGFIPKGNTVLFQGENCVELKAGFEVEFGAEFVGEIEECN